MMTTWQVRAGLGLCLSVCIAVLSGGCSDLKQGGGVKAKDEGGSATAKKKHDHSGWWCEEHGIPEEECSMCLPPKVVKELFKDKGDWCEKHDRAKSQCFICDPSLKEKFAAKYRAKYGEEPPPITDEETTKDEKPEAKK